MKAMEFPELSKLQRDIDELLARQIESLRQHHLDASDGGGFRRRYLEKKPKPSKASAATCVASLVAAGNWTGDTPWSSPTDTHELVSQMLDESRWTSAGLPVGNPFTVAFLLEAVTALENADKSLSLSPSEQISVSKAIEILQKALKQKKPQGTPGAAHLTLEQKKTEGTQDADRPLKYPPCAYLTQLVVRTLMQRKKLTESVKEKVMKWAWGTIEHELALAYSKSPAGDPYALSYSIMLVATCSDPSRATPVQNQILTAAVDCVFSSQLPDGSWPRSQPLFHYPEAGNAYCYEYEMLTQLLQCHSLTDHLLRHLPALALTVGRLRKTQFKLDQQGLGWASGHHPQLQGPESWSTASVYHYLHVLDRLMAEAFRRSVFSYVGAKYQPPTEPARALKQFATEFWDCEVKYQRRKRSLRRTLFKHFVQPVAKHSEGVANGKAIPKEVSISAILFGPPGTSKTQLAKLIAEFLGWPLLSIDPSHLVRKGLDQIQAETNTIFSMLTSAERVVVFLDEFDEMVRERKEGSEALSRFLTTAMLPKLASISDCRRIVLLLATNHIEQFDFAIKRPGRFDIVIQVMPPTLASKLTNAPELKAKLNEYAKGSSDLKKKLTDLTFAEFKDCVELTKDAKTIEELSAKITDCHSGCTLKQKVGDEDKEQKIGDGDKGQEIGDSDKETTWSSLCKEQAKQNRIPGL